jgi:two-component system, NtrC family, sensor kinase
VEAEPNLSETNLKAIEELKRQWMAMIDAIEDPLAMVSADFTIQRQNLAYQKQAQISKDIRQYKNEKCYVVFAGRTSPCLHCHLTESIEKQEIKTWNSADLQPGREFEMRTHPNADGSAVVQYRDVTLQKRLQESLAQADKLAALGKLTGGVAHELNSPLAGILAFAQMALKEMDDKNPHRSDLKEIEDATLKCKVIVEGMLGFARQDSEPHMMNFDLKESVLAVARLAGPALKKHSISLDLVTPEHAAEVKGHKGKIEQVILNLMTNALDAMKQTEGEIQLSLAAHGDSHWAIGVEDCGMGISPQVLAKIFDPFFTTKAVGEGTGLGLSISYSIAKLHGGQILVESTPGEGSLFQLVLPRAPK